jgi:hypothetical protein
VYPPILELPKPSEHDLALVACGGPNPMSEDILRWHDAKARAEVGRQPVPRLLALAREMLRRPGFEDRRVTDEYSGRRLLRR